MIDPGISSPQSKHYFTKGDRLWGIMVATSGLSRRHIFKTIIRYDNSCPDMQFMVHANVITTLVSALGGPKTHIESLQFDWCISDGQNLILVFQGGF